jgi:hypothetical protein
LAIFEYEDEIESFVSQHGIESIKGKNMHILAVQPGVQAYLKRKKIPYLNTVGFFNTKSHENLILKTAEIIKPFRDIVSIEDDLGVKEGYNNAFMFYLRHYSILYILWLIEMIDNAIEQLKPEKLISIKLEYTFDIMNHIPRNERYIGIIVGKLAQQKGLQAELSAGRTRQTNQIVKKVKSALLEILKISFFWAIMVFFDYKSRDKEYILYSSDSYNLGKVIESFVSRFSRNMYVGLYSNHKSKDLRRMVCDDSHLSILSCLSSLLPSNKRRGFLKELNIAITRLKDFFSKNKQILKYKEIDFQELVFLKIEKSMIPFLLTLYGQTYHLNKFLRNKNPALVLSQMARGLFYNLGELASFHNIPSVLISHGSHVPASNRYADLEWGEHSFGLMKIHYKYMAIQSPWALRYLKNNPSNSDQIITGPLLFTKTRSDENHRSSIKKLIIPQYHEKIIILHAGTPKPAQSLRPYVYETIDEYIENINSLINAVEKFEKIHLIVRFRPSDYLQLNDFLELLIKSDCYSVHSKGTFEDYLTISDLLVSYSSTTIEEALQNRVPILQYDGQGKYCHIKGQILEPSLTPELDSCYYVNAEGKLLWAIKWLLENHLKKDVPDNVWERHVFNNSEKVELSSYFRGLFLDNK